MKNEYGKMTLKGAFMALLAVIMAAGPSLAQTTYDLCATDGAVTMPDGAVISIWGYADITGGGGCNPGIATLPGPVIRPAAGDTTLTVNLTNSLAEPVSFFVPGLPAASTTGGAGRFTAEAAGNGGTASYTFDLTGRNGTFLYHSATDRIRTQVPLGLYGALVVEQTPGMAYPDVPYYTDEVLVFSEIDPVLNADPATYGGARVINWIPTYFLVNGQPYDNVAGSPSFTFPSNQDVLLRLVNAGLDTFVPTIDGGLYMNLKAEDGNRYPQPLHQYGVELQAGKTIDAIVNISDVGGYKLYDRGLNLANGGMVAVLQARSLAGTPTANADSYAVDEDTVLTADGVAPNPAGVLANDTGGAAAAVLVSSTTSGSLALAADGTFTYTPNPNFNGGDTFTYVANDGAGGPNSNQATVSITVNPINDGPVAANDSYDVVEGTILNVVAPGVLTNDVDVDGDALTVTTTPVVAPPGALTLNADGSFAYTPVGTAGAVETFDYEVCDAAPLCSTATVTVNVVAPPANIAPTANDDTTSSPRGTTLTNYNIVANDVDPDGTIDATSVVITTGATSQRGGTVVNNGDGTINYTPVNNGFRGTDTFQYTVNDNDGATSNVATVHINVVR